MAKQSNRLWQKTTSVVMSVVMVVGLMPSTSYAAEAAGTSDADEYVSVDFEQVDDATDQGTGMVNTVSDDESSEESEDAQAYADDDVVRASIILDGASTVEAGYDLDTIGTSAGAKAYRACLEEQQEEVTAQIEEATGEELDVKWNLTLAANMISADIEYGQIDEIEAIDGVDEVVIENVYEPAVVDDDETETAEGESTNSPMMATSGKQTGTGLAYAQGYTGAGSRVAVIDTGVDPDHESFTEEGLEYSFEQNAEEANMTLDAYKASLDLLTADEIAEVKDELNVPSYVEADDLYNTEKVAYGYNYIDASTDVSHDNDSQGAHGSHVDGIVAANRYVPADDEEGAMALESTDEFVDASENSGVVGVAPDAQLLIMKVFGYNGGAYDSDIIAGIEDAIVLGADSINLSLGSSTAGFTRASTEAYAQVYDGLTEHGATVCISAGNSYYWSYRTAIGALHTDDVSFDTIGSPGSYDNALTVASVKNAGHSDYSMTSGGERCFYNETDYSNEPLNTIAGEHEYVIISGGGTEDDWAEVGDALEGKIAFCNIYEDPSYFYQKAEYAVEAGAIATVEYNNTNNVSWSLGLSSYKYTEPVVSITKSTFQTILSNSTPVYDNDGETILYWTGTLTVDEDPYNEYDETGYYTMSAFSSWGATGDLTIKPEITAPGGYIYSVDGATEGGKSYTTMSGTSMAAPQVTGMAAVMAQYIAENDLTTKTGLTQRQLTQSLLMSTAEPMKEAESDSYYPVFQQGAGEANIGNAIEARSYIWMDEDATESAADGKVKAELGEDAERTGEYSFGFTVNNFSEEDASYALSGEYFIQQVDEKDGETYYSTLTEPIYTVQSYDVDGKMYYPQAADGDDLNDDGNVDSLDAQMILDYVSGEIDEIDEELADVDGDGDITSADAQMILNSIATIAVEVPAGESVHVTATATLTDETKEYIDETFENGTYIEGYVTVTPVIDDDSLYYDVAHSIPVLAYYGDTADASMYDQSSVAEQRAGDETSMYFSKATNALVYRKATAFLSAEYYVEGNPYVVDDPNGEERAAINGGDQLYYYSNYLIRNAAKQMIEITDSNGDVLYESTPSGQAYGAYYSGTFGWQFANKNYNISVTPDSIGAEDGDTITVSLISVPEKYASIAKTADDIEQLAADGAIDGGINSTSIRVDNEAPVLDDLAVSTKTGQYVVTAHDDQYIAAIEIANRTGSVVYDTILPEQDSEGQTVVQPLGDLSDLNLPNTWSIIVCDYAGNETQYRIVTDPNVDETIGTLYGFGTTAATAFAKRFVSVDPNGVWYQNASKKGGLTNEAGPYSFYVIAAEYVGGYVYMAASDGYWYIANLNDMDNPLQGGKWSDTCANIRDMAYNYADHTMYVLGSLDAQNTYDGLNQIYALNLTDCSMTLAYTVDATMNSVEIKNGSTSNWVKELVNLAIDDEGTFYSVSYNYGSSTHPTYLYEYSTDTADEDGVIKADPLNDTASGNLGFGFYSLGSPVTASYCWGIGSMTWDHDNDILYASNMGSNSVYSASTSNKLLIIDPATGTAKKSNSTYAGTASTTYAGATGTPLNGLFVVPKTTDSLPTSSVATALKLDKSEMNMIAGTSDSLEATIYPWNLTDMSITWTSTDSKVASVNANGGVTAVSAGTAIIRATSNTNDEVYAECTVNVRELQNVTFTALTTQDSNVGTGDTKTYWTSTSTGDLDTYNNVHECLDQYVGAAFGGSGLIYARNGEELVTIDPDTFETNDKQTITSGQEWTAAAMAPMQVMTDGTKAFGFYLTPYVSGNSSRIKAYVTEQNKETISNSSVLFSTGVILSNIYYNTVVAMCYAGYDPEYQAPIASYGKCPAEFFYILLDNGDIYKWTMYRQKANTYLVDTTNGFYKVGNIGLNVYGMNDPDEPENAVTMFYDEASDAIMMTYSTANGVDLYAIDSDTALKTLYGSMNSDIISVSGIFQYSPVTELTAQITSEVTEVYEKEQIQLTGRVLPTTYRNLYTWSSSDETVATIDQDGTVTGISDGTATITLTSVDTNAQGEHATASVDITVTGLSRVAGTEFTAQVTTTDEEGNTITKWDTLKGDAVYEGLTEGATSDVTLTGGGMFGDGYVYGSVGNYKTGWTFYQVDPATGEATKGGSQSVDSTGYAEYGIAGNLTDSPAVTWTPKDSEGNAYKDGDGDDITVTAFGRPVYQSASKNGVSWLFCFLESWEDATYSLPGGNYYTYAGTYYNDIMYMNTVYDETTGAPTQHFIEVTGQKILMYSVTASYDPETGEVSYTKDAVSGVTIGALSGYYYTDRPLVSAYVNDGTNEGIVVGYLKDSVVSFYYVDFTKETGTSASWNVPYYYTEKMGQIENVTDINVFYLSKSSNTGTTSVFDDFVPSLASVEQAAGVSTDAALSAEPAATFEDVQSGAAEADEAVAATEAASEKTVANKVTGALTATADEIADEDEADPYLVSYVYADDSDEVTNGRVTVSYDPEQMEFDSVESPAQYSAHVDEEAGTVTIAYATAEAIQPGEAVLTVSWRMTSDYADGTVTAVTSERNGDLGIEGDSSSQDVIREIGGHDYMLTYHSDATCTVDGIDTYTCSKCGDSYDVVTEAAGHVFASGSGTPVYDGEGAIVAQRFTCTVCGETVEYAVSDDSDHWSVLANGDVKFHFADGTYASGWIVIDESWYYFDPATGVMAVNQLVTTDGVTRYVDAQGIMQMGWAVIAGDDDVASAYYFYHDGETRYDGEVAAAGEMAGGWLKYANKWYYLDPTTGAMQTGFVKVVGKTYYMDEDGVMQTGWQKIDGSWYWFKASGAMGTGWLSSNGKWYYLDKATGIMQTGWVKVGSYWYYMSAKGVMQTGWIDYKGKCYYCDAKGHMLTGKQLIDGYYYTFTASGAWKGDKTKA